MKNNFNIFRKHIFSGEEGSGYKGLRSPSHWGYTASGVCLSLLLIVFWYFNRSYLASNKTAINAILENPLFTFGFITFGAFISAFLFKEFSVKVPLSYEPLVFSFVGGILMGFGAVIASMSTYSVVLFNLSGIFTLTAFMITKGWVYAVFMILGGFVGSKLFVALTLKTGFLKQKNDFRRNHLFPLARNLFFYVSLFFVIAFMVSIVLFSRKLPVERIGIVFAFLFLILFGIVTERGTICMSSMLKEWFISSSSYVWRSILFTIMLLALFYQIGLRFKLYDRIAVEEFIRNPVLLIVGSFLMGFGFIFADGCFIGSLWKAAQGNIVNMVGIISMLIGIFLGQVLVAKFPLEAALPVKSAIPNYLNVFFPPTLFLIIVLSAGFLFLFIFKPKHYGY